MDKYREYLDSLPTAVHREKDTGFVENWQTALGQAIDEETSIGRRINEQPIHERNRAIYHMIYNGEISNELVQNYSYNGQLDFGGLAEYLKTKGHDFKTDKELNDQIREDLQRRRRYANDVFANANTAGIAGQFAGNVHGQAVDPVLWPTYFVGVGSAAKATTFLGRFAKGAAIGGAAEGAAEIVRQPIIFDWKHDIGVDYSVGDALANITMAVGAAGTINGLAANISRYLQKTKSIDEPGAEEARRVLRNFREELEKAPDGEGSPLEHLERIETEIQRIEGKGPDPGHVVKESTEETLSQVDDTYAAFIETNPDATITKLSQTDAGEIQVGNVRLADEVNTIDENLRILQELKECLVGA